MKNYDEIGICADCEALTVLVNFTDMLCEGCDEIDREQATHEDRLAMMLEDAP